MKKMTICFENKEYGERLANYICRYHSASFQVRILPRESVYKEDTEFLVTDIEELSRDWPKERAFFLDFSGQGGGINPYLGAEAILSGILWNKNGKELRGEGRMRRILFYTPGGSGRQQEAALELFRQQAKKEVCIYIPVRDMDLCSEGEEGAYDLSELCYLLHLGETLSSDRIRATLQEEEGSFLMRGFRSPVHLSELSDCMSRLLQQMEEAIEEACVIMDLQLLPPDYPELFTSVEEIYAVDDVNTMESRERIHRGMERIKRACGEHKVNYGIWKWAEEITEGDETDE